MCSEPVLKMVEGVTVNLLMPQVERAVGPQQFGAGRSGGASAQVAEVRAAASFFDDRPIITTDIQNAFGAVRWSDAVRVCLERVPGFAVLLHAQLSEPGGVEVWVQTTQTDWESFTTTGSLLQGSPPIPSSVLHHHGRNKGGA